MASTLIKATIGLAGATTIGGGATFVYLNSGNNKAVNQDESKSNKETQIQPDSPTEVKKKEANTVINTLFKAAKIALLTEEGEDTGKWTQKWADFKAAYKNLKEPEAWKFDDWGDNGPQEEAGIAALKQKCTANSAKKVVDQTSQLFLDVKAFCTKEVTSPSN